MKKILLILMMGMLLVSFALADDIVPLPDDNIDDGDVLNQEDIDEMDVESLNLNCRYTGWSFIWNGFGLEYHFTCLSIQPEEDSEDYKVKKRKIDVIYNLDDWIICRLLSSPRECLEDIQRFVFERFIIQKNDIRNEIIEYQEIESFDDIDYNIDFGDLNER